MEGSLLESHEVSDEGDLEDENLDEEDLGGSEDHDGEPDYEDAIECSRKVVASYLGSDRKLVVLEGQYIFEYPLTDMIDGMLIQIGILHPAMFESTGKY